MPRWLLPQLLWSVLSKKYRIAVSKVESSTPKKYSENHYFHQLICITAFWSIGGIAQATTVSCMAINDDASELGASTYAGAVWLTRAANSCAINCDATTAGGFPSTVDLRHRTTYAGYHNTGFIATNPNAYPVQITNNVLAHANDSGTSLAQGVYVTFASGATNISVVGSSAPATGGSFSRFLNWNLATIGSAAVTFDFQGETYAFTMVKPSSSSATINSFTVTRTGCTTNNTQNIPVFGPLGLLAMFLGLMWVSNNYSKE